MNGNPALISKVALNKLLINKAGYSLSNAKKAVDNLLDGKTIGSPQLMRRD